VNTSTSPRRRGSKPWFKPTRRKRGTGLGWWLLYALLGYAREKAEGKRANPYAPPSRKTKPPKSGSGGGGGSKPNRPVDDPRRTKETPRAKDPDSDVIDPIDEGDDPHYRGPGADDPIEDAEEVDPEDEDYIHDGEIDPDDDSDEELPLVDEDGEGPAEITDNYSWTE